MTTDELKEIASQLKNPHGEKGRETGRLMHETNIAMTYHAIDMLNFRRGDKILELGHGICGHLEYLLGRQEGLAYRGLDISVLMNDEAKKINKTLIKKNQAEFSIYDGIHIPFPNNCFDKIFTVNTVYFWSEPASLLNEIYRVVKAGGTVNITFADSRFMEQLPFIRYGFTLYDIGKMEKLAAKTPFDIVAANSVIEKVKIKTGQMMDREFTTVSLQKPVDAKNIDGH